MPPVFIFAEQVRKILKAGKKEIEIPEGARISAAASELIKDNKLRIVTSATPATTAADAPQTKAPSGEPPAPPQAKPSEAVAEKISGEKQMPSISGDEISDDELEAMVNRVIERFKQIKGIAPAPAAQKPAVTDELQRTPAEDDDLIICRCEEITKGEIKEAIRNGIQTLNGIKRVTRAGMGLCQGQTCQRLVSQILTEELGLSLAEVEPTTARGPVRPLKMAVFANR